MANALSHPQFYKLCQYIKSLKPRIATESLRLSQVLKIANESVGFVVTEANLESACKVTGIKLSAGRPRSGRYPAGKGVYYRIMAKAILQIADELGVALHPDVRQIALGRPLSIPAPPESPPVEDTL